MRPLPNWLTGLLKKHGIVPRTGDEQRQADMIADAHRVLDFAEVPASSDLEGRVRLLVQRESLTVRAYLDIVGAAPSIRRAA